MGGKILIDTNIAIGYVGNRLDIQLMNKLDTIFDGTYHLSVINKIEILGYPNLNVEEEKVFNLLINNAILHPIDNAIIKKTIEIKKNYRIKLPDALIAATCLVYKLEILTLNFNDFKSIKDLSFFNTEG
ncbi:MAG: type II toxin-antitoxin system VapC family toxin [Mariniphaga sp.]|nr:type II toxin-antitoxin system VapC family toxin [Mariniphaga sp.]